MIAAALLLAAVVSQAQPNVVLEPVVGGFNDPVTITHANDARLFIVEQTGLVRVFDPPQVRSEPFLDVRSLISTGGERGLLGLAFHPRYAENGFFFVNYTDRNGDTAIVRYTRSSNDPNRADPASARTILRVDQPYANHNGGQLAFGPDGYLYIALGDGGSGGDPGNRAQNLSELLGKMLRIDVDNGNPYAIPPTNPYVGRPGARGEIWASGLRNPWRCSFDRNFGDLWIADVGQGAWEEVSMQPFGSIGGENYGWRRMEGTHCFNPGTGCNDGTLVLPVIEYDHSFAACSVTGGYVYRGTRSRRLNDMYIYADFCNGRIMGARRQPSGIYVSQLLFDAPFTIATFGEDMHGELYVGDYNSGQIYRIVDTVPMPGKRRSAGR
ncbi:MAG TPA: PQQ-dependent sugar dehydrogenase [Thermoanaerobaculia bacterium]|nr:PQQ-dependent sugar dehydrogenase [Thermoanaerobaculia bacterium]